jgi:hypothetical protein
VFLSLSLSLSHTHTQTLEGLKEELREAAEYELEICRKQLDFLAADNSAAAEAGLSLSLLLLLLLLLLLSYSLSCSQTCMLLMITMQLRLDSRSLLLARSLSLSRTRFASPTPNTHLSYTISGCLYAHPLIVCLRLHLLISHLCLYLFLPQTLQKFLRTPSPTRCSSAPQRSPQCRSKLAWYCVRVYAR